MHYTSLQDRIAEGRQDCKRKKEERKEAIEMQRNEKEKRNKGGVGLG